MLEYDENTVEEQQLYMPYDLCYEEQQSIDEIETTLRRGSIDRQTVSDFKEYLHYLKNKVLGIISAEKFDGRELGELPGKLSRIQHLLFDMNHKPIF